MGFFADIIRDSRRGGMAAHAPEAPVSLGGKETPADAPAVAENARVEPAAASGSDWSVIRLRRMGAVSRFCGGESFAERSRHPQVVGLRLRNKHGCGIPG